MQQQRLEFVESSVTDEVGGVANEVGSHQRSCKFSWEMRVLSAKIDFFLNIQSVLQKQVIWLKKKSDKSLGS